MRLTVDLEPDLYALAKSFSKAEDCTISAAINRLLRRALPGNGRQGDAKPVRRNGFVVSRGAIPVTPDLVRQIEEEEREG